MTTTPADTTTAGADADVVLAPPLPTPDGGRVQLALNVDDLGAAVAFYSKLFGTAPVKVRPGYANFSIAAPPLKLVLLENAGRGGSINHLGVEVPDTQTVHSEIARLSSEGLLPDEEMGTTCCFATQDKVWVTGPAGVRWEVYTVLADSATFGQSPQTLIDAGQAPADGVCCSAETSTGTSTTPAACC
jgi:catechol 2,3-dioxygenase-like lactoylglutathione lyase family enzyme